MKVLGTYLRTFQLDKMTRQRLSYLHTNQGSDKIAYKSQLANMYQVHYKGANSVGFETLAENKKQKSKVWIQLTTGKIARLRGSEEL
jgi:hypothetical protein